MLRNGDQENLKNTFNHLRTHIRELGRTIEGRKGNAEAKKNLWWWQRIFVRTSSLQLKTLLEEFDRLLDNQYRNAWASKELREKELTEFMQKATEYYNERNKNSWLAPEIERLYDDVQARYYKYVDDSIKELEVFVDQSSNTKWLCETLQKSQKKWHDEYQREMESFLSNRRETKSSSGPGPLNPLQMQQTPMVPIQYVNVTPGQPGHVAQFQEPFVQAQPQVAVIRRREPLPTSSGVSAQQQAQNYLRNL